MILFTGKWTWTPLYAFVIVFLVLKHKTHGIAMVLFLVLLVVITDQVTSSIMKPLFERLRPCHNDYLNGFLHLPHGCGGKYGFVSSHAANTVGFASFLIFAFRYEYRRVYYLLAWAFLVSYSRIYLGAHYPVDVLAGALVGVFFAAILYFTYSRMVRPALNQKYGHAPARRF